MGTLPNILRVWPLDVPTQQMLRATGDLVGHVVEDLSVHQIPQYFENDVPFRQVPAVRPQKAESPYSPSSIELQRLFLPEQGEKE